MAEGYRPQFRQTARIREIGRYLETHPGEPVTLPQLPAVRGAGDDDEALL